MLRDPHAGRPGWDTAEFAADAVGGVRLRVEALVLGQPAGEEDVDHRAGRGLSGPGGPEMAQLAESKPEEADRTGLERRAAGERRVSESGAGGHLAVSAGVPSIADQDAEFNPRHRT